jgi:hypothetical protein
MEGLLYSIIFGIILLILGFYVLKHLKALFLLGLKKLDEYVVNKSSLDQEDFAVSMPHTPRLYVMNSSLGSAIAFKPEQDESIMSYLCTIKNTTDIDAAVQIKVIKDTEPLLNENGYVVIDLQQLNDTDNYSIAIHPITKDGKGLASNLVYAYKKDDDLNTPMIETTSIDTNLDNYNFSTHITRNIHHK